MTGLRAFGRCLRAVGRWLNNNFELSMMLPLYALFTAILAVEVGRRFLFGEQTPWGSTVVIYLFIWVSWLGCSWGVRRDSHLSFPGVREKLPTRVRISLKALDNLLWIALCPVILYGATKLLDAQLSLASDIHGTSLPQWWAFLIIPIAWLSIVVRAVQNLVALWRDFQQNSEGVASETGQGKARGLVAQ